MKKKILRILIISFLAINGSILVSNLNLDTNIGLINKAEAKELYDEWRPTYEPCPEGQPSCMCLKSTVDQNCHMRICQEDIHI